MISPPSPLSAPEREGEQDDRFNALRSGDGEQMNVSPLHRNGEGWVWGKRYAAASARVGASSSLTPGPIVVVTVIERM
jgi:hypothetical protein